VPPLGRSGGSAILEWLPVDKSALRIAVIVDRGVQRGKFLQTSHLPEAEYRPLPSSDMSHSSDPAPPDLCGKDCLEPNPSRRHHLIGNVDSPRLKQVPDSPQRQRIANVHHHGQAGDLGQGLEVAEDAASAHTIKANGTRTSRRPFFL